MAELMKRPRRGKTTLLQKRDRKGYLFILPWVIGFAVFYVRSIFMTLQFSFSKLTMDAASGAYKLEPVGIDNFVYAFRVHPDFKQVLTTSVVDMVVDVPLIIFFSLFIAKLRVDEMKLLFIPLALALRLSRRIGLLNHPEMERTVTIHTEVDGVHMVDMLPDGRIEIVGDVDVTFSVLLRHHTAVFSNLSTRSTTCPTGA